MNDKTAIFKIGGKILENIENLNSTISQFKQLNIEKLLNKIILIPGGGSFANFIRKVYSELKFTEEIAHWMGIISMNYNGLELKNKFPELDIIENFNKLKKSDKSIIVFLPYEFLKEQDKLPHSWDVTSDSIAILLAKELGLKECFLIKDVDGILNNKNELLKEILTTEFENLKEKGKIYEVKSNVGELKERSTPIDLYSINLIHDYNISCIILNGSKNLNRILDYFKKEKQDEKLYTRIK
ncbi:MAG: hypothetical protein ACFE9Z_06625 [Promethearchaeota archaeon]